MPADNIAYRSQQEKGKSMMAQRSGVFARVMPVFLVLCAIYLICVILGLVLTWVQGDATGTTDQVDEAKQRSIEALFGKFREPLRRGNVESLAVVTLIVFMVNMLGNMVNFTLPGIFLVPAVALVGYTGWSQGVSLAWLKASSLASIIGFLGVVSLESISYIVAATAGVNVGLGLVHPRWLGETSRLPALRRTCRDALHLYGVVALLLLVQAVAEVLYVRQVLLHGGSGVPLQPY